jgi:hypothetical protein
MLELIKIKIELIHVEGSEWMKMGLGVTEHSSVVKRWHARELLEATGDN